MIYLKWFAEADSNKNLSSRELLNMCLQSVGRQNSTHRLRQSEHVERSVWFQDSTSSLHSRMMFLTLLSNITGSNRSAKKQICQILEIDVHCRLHNLHLDSSVDAIARNLLAPLCPWNEIALFKRNRRAICLMNFSPQRQRILFVVDGDCTGVIIEPKTERSR